MTNLTEGRHAAEFIVSEANGHRSRSTATVASGEVLVAGQAVQLSGGKLVAADGVLDSAGAVVTAVAGIMFDGVDATAGDVEDAVYISRDAEVNQNEVTYPTETTAGGEQAAVNASLAELGIIARS